MTLLAALLLGSGALDYAHQKVAHGAGPQTRCDPGQGHEHDHEHDRSPASEQSSQKSCPECRALAGLTPPALFIAAILPDHTPSHQTPLAPVAHSVRLISLDLHLSRAPPSL